MIRILVNGFRIHFLQLSRSGFDILGMTAWPILNATMAYYLFGIGGNSRVLFSASLGATVMAIWASVTTGSSGALDFQRRLGTLELLVAAPVPFLAILAPITIATASVGIYAFGSTLLWGRLVFGIPLHVVHPALFVAALLVAVIAIGMLGLIIATTVIVYRQALFLGNSFEYPGFLITGLLVPLSVLPGWVTPIAWLLAPTWGMRAIRAAAFGGSALRDIAVCVGLSIAYVAVAAICLRGLEHLARSRATLALS
ncbi:MAG TPA: ABC transporter permease [Gaiellaceae bacterium]|nr:ABC transporter permease [Gaiellaceae bacterium]